MMGHVDNMPVASINNLPAGAKKIFESTMESLKGKKNPRTEKLYTDEERGMIAWTAVKKKYKKVDSRWVIKSFAELPFTRVYSDRFEFKSEGDNYFVDFYVSVPSVDKYKDLTTPECLEDMKSQILGRDISVKMSLDHDAVFFGKDLLPHAKIVESNLDEVGLKARAKMNKFHPEFKSVWGSIKDGFLDSASIEFKPIDYEFKNIGGEDVRVLNRVLLGGVGFTGRPVNDDCKITDFFVKSLAFCNDNQNRGENMTDETKNTDGTNPASPPTTTPTAPPAAPETKAVTKDEEEEAKKKKKTKDEASDVADAKKKKKEEEEETKSTTKPVSEAEYLELKSRVDQYEAGVRLQEEKLKNEIKSVLKEELKSLHPAARNIVENREKFSESTGSKPEDFSVKSLISRHFGSPQEVN